VEKQRLARLLRALPGQPSGGRTVPPQAARRRAHCEFTLKLKKADCKAVSAEKVLGDF